MVKRPGMPETPRGGAMTAQHVLRFVSIVIGIAGVTVLGIAYYQRATTPAAPASETTKPETRKPASDEAIRGALEVALAESAANRDDNGAKRAEYAFDPQSGELRRVNDDLRSAFLGPILDGSDPSFLQFCRLLEKVNRHLPADDPTMEAAREVDPGELAADPEKYRGLPVTVRGTVAYRQRQPLPDNPTGLKAFVEMEIDVPGQGRCVVAASRVSEQAEGQAVVIHGLFMQMVTRKAKGGEKITAPLLITSHPIPVVPRKGVATGTSVMITIVAVLFVVYFVMMFMLRRKSQRRNPILEARRKVRALAAQRKEGETAPDETEAAESDEHGTGQPG